MHLSIIQLFIWTLTFKLFRFRDKNSTNSCEKAVTCLDRTGICRPSTFIGDITVYRIVNVVFDYVFRFSVYIDEHHIP